MVSSILLGVHDDHAEYAILPLLSNTSSGEKKINSYRLFWNLARVKAAK